MKKTIAGFLAAAIFAPVAVFATTIAQCVPFTFAEHYSVDIHSLPAGVEVRTHRDSYGGEFDYLINTSSSPLIFQGVIGVSNVGKTVTLVGGTVTVAYVNGSNNEYSGDAAAGAATLSQLVHNAIGRKIYDATVRPAQPAPESFAVPAFYGGRSISITGVITYVMHENTCAGTASGGISSGTSITDKISALLAQIKALQDLILSLRSQSGVPVVAPPYESPHNSPAPSAACSVPINDLYMGKTDAQTNGEVTKLQLFLAKEGMFAAPQTYSPITGYYGQLTAAAVMKWQKAHGMDFVTLTSGVGKQTRTKMQEACGKPAVAQCAKYDDQPIITSITPLSGPVGTTIEIQGCNFLGFEGDKVLWFTNSKGEKGILNGNDDAATRASNTVMRITLPRTLCRTMNWYSGLDCSVLELAPGAYSIFSNSYGGNSNVVNFTITASNNAPVISSITGPTTISVHTQGTWKVEVTDPENDALKYVVRWGDEPSPMDVAYPFNWPALGFATAYNLPTFTHMYSKAGTYEVRVAVIDIGQDINHAKEKTLTIVVQ